MIKSFRLRGCVVVVGLLWVLAGGATAAQAEPAYVVDPVLSLTGDCTTSSFDPVPDPSCPYPLPPGGPVERFAGASSVTIDQAGNVFVSSYAEGSDSKGRVDVFDDEGTFITEAAIPNVQSMAVDGEGNLYVYEDLGAIVRYEPSKYQAEAGVIEYKNAPVTVSTGGAIGSVGVNTSNNHLYEARFGTVTERGSAVESNAVIESYEPEGIGPWTNAIAVDPERGRVFVSFCKKEGEECGVKILAAGTPHAVLKEIDGSTTPAGEFLTGGGRLGIAVDIETGAFFISDPLAKEIYSFAADYSYQSEIDFGELKGFAIAVSNGERSLAAEPCGYPDPEDFEVPAGDACNRHYLFVPAFFYPGRLAAFHQSDEAAPVIESVSTGGIDEDEAELRATIDSGNLVTKYSFEITTQAAWEAETEKFEDATVIPGGVIQAGNAPVEVAAFASGLVPGETYRFRVVAENDLGPAKEEGQNEASFATYADASIGLPCANEALRLGASAHLADCRAYELVTPTDTTGRSPRGSAFVGNIFTSVHSSPEGGSVSFKIEGGSLPDTSGVGSFEGDPYLAQRTPSGWHSALAGADGSEATSSIPGGTSPDQGYSFWTARIEGSAVIGGIPTTYLRYPDGHSELIGRGSEGTEPRAQGLLITKGATHILFASLNVNPEKAVPLEPDAPPAGTRAIYDRTIDPITGAEATYVVSLLPGNITPGAGQDAGYVGASKDGGGVAFSIGKILYLRVGNETTYEVGEEVEFAGVSEGGGRIFYVEGGNLKALDTTGPTPKVIDFSSTGNVTPVNVSTDGTRAYFVSPSVLGGANPEGDVAQGGQQNLYLSEAGTISFVATVTERDVKGAETSDKNRYDGLGLLTEVGKQLARDPSRTNPDGSVLLFQSRAEITGYGASEFPQVYRYDSTEGELQCISCIPTKTPATGGASLESYTFDSFSPRPFSPYGFVPNLTPGGKRVIFESTEALVSTDTDEVNDVYEWEANGVGSCKQPEGCVYLISSGQSERDNFLYAHSASGDDIFFTTSDALTGSDSGGAISIYDARVNGGFPEADNGEPCIGDGCRPLVTPPPVFEKPKAGGDGDVQHKSKICPKGKHKVKKNGKVRCVKKKQSKKHKGKGGKAKQRAGAGRGAGK